MKKKIIKLIVILIVIASIVGILFALQNNKKSSEGLSIEERLDKEFKRFANFGGSVARSHRKGNMPTENIKEKLEIIVSDNMDIGQTATIVLTKMSQGGLSYPRVELLVGLYTNNNFEYSFSLKIVAMDKEFSQERMNREGNRRDIFEDEVSNFRKQSYIIWEYTKDEVGSSTYEEDIASINDLINPYIIEEGEYYQIIGGDNFRGWYRIFDKDKNVVKEEECGIRTPRISMTNDNVVEVWGQAGTGMFTRWFYYYDIEKDVFSETFIAVYDEKNGRIAYDNWDGIHTLIIRDIFDKEKYYYEITNFNNILATISEPFTDVKILDNGKQIQVTYITGSDNTGYSDYKEVIEIINLPE